MESILYTCVLTKYDENQILGSAPLDRYYTDLCERIQGADFNQTVCLQYHNPNNVSVCIIFHIKYKHS